MHWKCFVYSRRYAICDNQQWTVSSDTHKEQKLNCLQTDFVLFGYFGCIWSIIIFLSSPNEQQKQAFRLMSANARQRRMEIVVRQQEVAFVSTRSYLLRSVPQRFFFFWRCNFNGFVRLLVASPMSYHRCRIFPHDISCVDMNDNDDNGTAPRKIVNCKV